MLAVNRSRSLLAFFVGAALSIAGVVTFQAVRADAVGEDETTFVPMTSCRLIDTRPDPNRVGPFGTFGDNDTKTIVAHGSNGNCVIPATASGLSLNVTALHATEITYLTFWDEGDRPKASSLNPAPGEPPTPNAVNVPLSDTGTFRVYNAYGAVNIIIDVTGYYTNTGLQELAASLPITASAETGDIGFITLPTISLGMYTPVEVLSVTLEAPGDGKVTVAADAYVFVMGGSDEYSVACSVTEGFNLELFHTAYYKMPPQVHASGLRVFDVNAGQILTYRFICGATSPVANMSGPLVSSAHMSAIFTPAAP